MEKDRQYIPRPVNTEHVQLPEDLISLTEKIAENIHNVWAYGRMQEGWRGGEVRDDRNKLTPCMVPYEELPENEKEYDRRTAMESLKLITVLGYTIEKKEKD